jgi:hypothetical protein
MNNGVHAALSCAEKFTFFAELTHIELDHSQMVDVSPVAALRNLAQISLDNNPIAKNP